MTDTLTVYSMFAGIGGIDLGLEATGRFETVAFSEVDDFACETLTHRWPGVPNVGDCTTCDYTNWQHENVDVIAAGFPCQDISLAGNQKGIQDGTRSGLWFEVVRAARDLRPRYLLLENVAAITSSNDGDDFRQVLGDLAALGYDAEWAIIRASDVGAPHQRARWFCIAWLADTDSSERQALTAQLEQRRDTEKRPQPAGSRSRQSNSETVGDATSIGHGENARHPERERARPVAESGEGSIPVAEGLADTDSERFKERNRPRQSSDQEQHPRRDSEAASGTAELADTDSIGRREGRIRQPTPTSTDRSQGGNPQRQTLSTNARVFRQPRPATAWSEGVIGTDGRITKPGLRLLAHGVPRRVAKLRALGNAVVPAVAEHVAHCLINHHDNHTA